MNNEKLQQTLEKLYERRDYLEYDSDEPYRKVEKELRELNYLIALYERTLRKSEKESY